MYYDLALCLMPIAAVHIPGWMGAWRLLCAWPYSKNMGFGKIAFWRYDENVYDVMDRDGQPVHVSQGTSTEPHHYIHAILSYLA
jgi:hypothetical protein